MLCFWSEIRQNRESSLPGGIGFKLCAAESWILGDGSLKTCSSLDGRHETGAGSVTHLGWCIIESILPGFLHLNGIVDVEV
jgi:hypothetical protein